ncbi:MAG: hypothetical protein J0L89_02680 [Xanthomonadales bacterium]|nr:hypothetical protein [Xanthomonadaceae bacterium]MBN8223703.1 hypothetical protein [Xanthomonadales bacterium]MCA0198196.1 hypothetical protein [Pseudomonadota bacterium]
MALETTAKALALWTLILLLAIANGLLREAVLIPRIGAFAGTALSGLLLAALILAVAYLGLPWMPVRRAGGLLWIGLGWLLLTLAFEFSFGLLRGQALVEILEAYTFKGGNLWPLVLAVTAAAPWLAARRRGWL